MPNKGNAGIPQQKGKTVRPTLYYQRRGTGWTGVMFHTGLKSLMGDLKPDKHCYNTHSLRIWAATYASLANCQMLIYKFLAVGKAMHSKGTSGFPPMRLQICLRLLQQEITDYLIKT